MGCSFSGSAPTETELRGPHGDLLMSMHASTRGAKSRSQRSKRLRAFESVRHAISENRIISNTHIRAYYGNHRNYYWHLVIYEKNSKPSRYTWFSAVSAQEDSQGADMESLERKEFLLWRILSNDKGQPGMINFERAYRILKSNAKASADLWNQANGNVSLFLEKFDSVEEKNQQVNGAASATADDKKEEKS
jgi:hypothetical protein